MSAISTAGLSPTLSEIAQPISSLCITFPSGERQERIATALSRLPQHVLERKELENGLAYRFSPTDEVPDELLNLVKKERPFCDFLLFKVLVSEDGSGTWLEITGPPLTEEFVLTGLEF